MTASAIALTFHRISAALSGFGESPNLAADRYTLPAQRLGEILDVIPASVCTTVREFGAGDSGNWVILTFDDGFLSDYGIAFHELLARGMKATFFVTAENVGRKGYTDFAMLREMHTAGMEIGSHGRTHRYLITLPRLEAFREIRESRDRLEQELGTGITSFAPVGGHFQRWMREAAAEAGYDAFATMIPGKTIQGRNGFLLRRNHLQSHHNAKYAQRLVNGDAMTLKLNLIRYRLLNAPKALVGIERYDHLKDVILRAIPRRRVAFS